MTRQLQWAWVMAQPHTLQAERNQDVRCNVTTTVTSNEIGVPQRPGAPTPTVAPPPPPAPIPIAAPEAVSLRPDTQVGVKRKKSRRDRLGSN